MLNTNNKTDVIRLKNWVRYNNEYRVQMVHIGKSQDILDFDEWVKH